MIKLSAVLINIFKTDEYTNKETGAVTAPKKKFQLMVEKHMKNGTTKKELLDISVKDEVYLKHKDSIGKTIEIDVGYFGQGITFFGI
jgi:hypothetical protein